MSSHQLPPVRGSLMLSMFLVIICAVTIVMITTGVAAEKTASNLTIGTLPEDPTINQSFHVSGVLGSSNGKPLGNKRVTLESNQKDSSDAEGFAFIGIKETDAGGKFDFFRPVDSPPEFLRVKFAGNDNYEPVMSPVISVRGAGTDHPQIRTGMNGSIMVYTTPQGANIYVDDILRGISPYRVGGLSEGSHVLTVNKAGYINQTMDAYVTSDRDATIDITFQTRTI